ncbi:efflux RND transporter periplasmic adaptor subunit [Brevundimonas sp. A19_0]|uniref:efflux RND transporter periplasmic adaptor subunit n=1 Tax=Brevundimonas sp. A19_0 TaxID=2821087 RepID=UPI001ADC36DA|nr:efflux RND transporter periplasmic adaptor subunit [Brevundimonas sp. A19_0]MBO9500971.1 efflux RND transporter periplasmic adaptor subunit [Brevundimonas sp. A19_0]
MKSMLPALAALVLLSACSGDGQEAAEAHAAGSVTVTHYSPATELFVEYRPLVLDRRRRFDAHLSRVSDYRAVAEGRLTVELVWPDGHVDAATAPVSDTPGIFRPLLRATRTGQARLRFRHVGERGESVHDLGLVTVHRTSEEAAKAAPPHEENPNRIAFPKEAQWKVPFATRPVGDGLINRTLPVTVDVRIAPDAEAIISAPVTGVIRTGSTVPATGMPVRAGQTLASISAQLGGGEDVASLDLEISQARIELDAARREVARMTRLVEAEAAPQRRLDEARTTERLAAARLQAAQRRRASLAGGGPGVPVVAPISGRILRSTLVRGASVEAGTELMRIGDPNRLWLVARVPEAQASGLTTALGLDVMVEGRRLDLPGLRRVTNVGFVDPESRTSEIIFAYDGSAVRPGQRVQGRLSVGEGRRGLSVPASAILNESGQDVVYVQVEGEAFERRIVTVGERSGDRVAVTGDLRAGERVVSTGASIVRAAAATPDAFGHGHAH